MLEAEIGELGLKRQIFAVAGFKRHNLMQLELRFKQNGMPWTRTDTVYASDGSLRSAEIESDIEVCRPLNVLAMSDRDFNLNWIARQFGFAVTHWSSGFQVLSVEKSLNTVSFCLWPRNDIP